MTNLSCLGENCTIDFPKEIVSCNLEQKYTYIFSEKIAKRTYSEVLMYICTNTNQKVAIKVKFSANTKDSKENIALKSMNHPNIVKYIDFLVIGEYEYIIMEYVPCTLEDYLEKQVYGLKDIKIILKQILDAMKYLEYIQVIHINIKPNNILLDENLNVKLIDFAICCTIQDKSLNFSIDSDLDTALKEFPQIAPEILSGDFFDNSADIYSFGYVCLFIQERFIENVLCDEKNKKSNDLLSNLIYNSYCSFRTNRSSITGLIFHQFFDELYESLECFCNFDNMKPNMGDIEIWPYDGKIHIKKDNIEFTLYCSCHDKLDLDRNLEYIRIQKTYLSTFSFYNTTNININKFSVKIRKILLHIKFLYKEDLLHIIKAFEIIKKSRSRLSDKQMRSEYNQSVVEENRVRSENKCSYWLRGLIRSLCG
ncbi:protein kinase [Hamiltosporidium magnivora]|uniref:Protein kinase n=1 Tax=Hamiltosporidium magnivora TaxID=148818 RepID=A0A4Q9LGU2_9MICR|nr:protein kinase [Hamiltosporidium magnivora]